MGDLISRKYVVKELLKEREHFPPMVAERYSLGVKLPHRFNQAMRGGIRKALRIAETAPAVEAEPVRHGEWKEASGCRTICNNCGHYPLYDYFGRLKLSPYCWFCGVKMRGDKVGEGN